LLKASSVFFTPWVFFVFFRPPPLPHILNPTVSHFDRVKCTIPDVFFLSSPDALPLVLWSTLERIVLPLSLAANRPPSPMGCPGGWLLAYVLPLLSPSFGSFFLVSKDTFSFFSDYSPSGRVSVFSSVSATSASVLLSFFSYASPAAMHCSSPLRHPSKPTEVSSPLWSTPAF